MKVLYVVTGSEEYYKSKDLGVLKKIRNQVAALNAQGVETELRIIEREPNWKTYLPFQTSTINWRTLKKTLYEYDGVYLRYNCADWMMLRTFSYFKRKNSLFKILIELPTYPYDNEITKKRLRYVRDHICREFLYKCVDRIVTYSRDAVIWNVPTIETMNGIDINAVRSKASTVEANKFNIVFVANFARHHGMDRLIGGMIDYYNHGGSKDIIIHIVGNISDDVKEDISDLIKNELIKDRLIFYGSKTGDDLDRIFDKSNIAIASLACHRNGVEWLSTLKTREYLARGIPFAYSGTIDVFESDPVDFALKYPSDDSPISIEQLLQFYDNLMDKESIMELTRRIRLYAEKHISMIKVMKPVADYYKNDVIAF